MGLLLPSDLSLLSQGVENDVGLIQASPESVVAWVWQAEQNGSPAASPKFASVGILRQDSVQRQHFFQFETFLQPDDNA